MGRMGRSARRGEEGFTLIEVLIASAVMLVTSLSLAAAFSATGLSSRSSDRAVAIQTSFESTMSGLEEVPYHELLSWNGTQVDRGDHRVEILTRRIEVGLVLVEMTAVDDGSGRVLARLATYRSGGLSG